MAHRNTPSLLSADALKQAAWYAAAFGATASLATSADAQVLYGDPDDILVQSTFVEGEDGLEPAGIPLDLDGDGDPEISLRHRGAEQGTPYTYMTSAFPEDAEVVVGDFLSNLVGQNFPFNGEQYPYFAPLSAGYVLPDDVGLDFEFIEDFPLLGTFTFAGSNQLSVPVDEDSYIGIEFTLDDSGTEAGDGTVHYGWMRVQLLSEGGFILKDYGFNATPEGSIEVGEIGEPIIISTEDDLAVQGYSVRTAGANPFGEAGTRLQVAVSQAETVRVDVYNVLGQRVETLHDNAIAGQQTFSFGSDYVAGLYVVRVTGESFQQTLKVTRN